MNNLKENNDAFLTVACFFMNEANRIKKLLDTTKVSVSDRKMYSEGIDGLMDFHDYCSTLDEIHISSFIAKGELSQEMVIELLFDEYYTVVKDKESALDKNLKVLGEYETAIERVFLHLLNKLGR